MFWLTSRRRAALEAGVIALLLVIALRSEQNTLLAAFAFLWLSTLGAIWAAFRARLSQQFLAECGFVIGINVLIQVIALLVYGPVLLPQIEQEPAYLIGYLGSVLALTMLLGVLRAGMILWRRWQQIRQRRLLWAIVHVQVLTIMVIAGVLALHEGINAALSSPFAPSSSSEVLVPLLSLLTPLIFYAVIVTPVGAVVLLLAGSIAYLIARPITDRVEKLAQVTGQLRTGDYSARVVVDGVDEIAQLQSDFNIMASTLEQTLDTLKGERDTVQVLLQNRREWLASVSHELRTPVATIRSHLELPPQENQPHDLDVVRREVLRLQALLEDLFALARSDTGQLTLKSVPTDIQPTLNNIIATFTPLAWQKASVRVVGDIAPNLSPAVVDNTRLEQILYNLLHNSLRHTPPGGIVGIRATQEGETICIVVEDTGEGIAPEVLERIWEPFYSADDHIQNAGLGLALVKSLVTAMNARISVRSTLGQGTRFTLYLPGQPAA